LGEVTATDMDGLGSESGKRTNSRITKTIWPHFQSASVDQSHNIKDLLEKQEHHVLSEMSTNEHPEPQWPGVDARKESGSVEPGHTFTYQNEPGYQSYFGE